MKTIIRLLTEHSSISEQVTLIHELNRSMFSASTLLDIALFLRKKMVAVPGHTDAADIVGTGGDGFDTLNFSTLGSFIAAEAGIKMAKHGNKGSTSQCGSFDLLESLNIDIPASAQAASAQLSEQGLSFLFAPFFHPILKNVASARKIFAKEGQKTIFNHLGPLLNPASVTTLSTGVYTPKLIEPYVTVLQELGVKKAFVVHGSGMDEFTLTGETQYVRISGDDVERGIFRPQDFGFQLCHQSEIIGGNIQQNTAEATRILNYSASGPKMDMVILQAASVIALKEDLDIDEAVVKIKASLWGNA